MSNHTLQISYYKTLLLSMKQKITGGKSNVAKPVLVLATINLIEKGEIIGNKIEFNESLIKEYNKLINSYNEINTLCQYSATGTSPMLLSCGKVSGCAVWKKPALSTKIPPALCPEPSI